MHRFAVFAFLFLLSVVLVSIDAAAIRAGSAALTNAVRRDDATEPKHLAARGIENVWGSGLFNNTSNRTYIVAMSTNFSGQYYMQNVATKAYLWWNIHPQTIIPSNSSRSAMTLRPFGFGTQVHPTPSNDKCLAAQWNTDRGVDWAGVMYACQTAGSNASNTDAKEKQQWHFLPVAGNHTQYYVIPENHLSNMHTRALSSREVDTDGGYKSTTVDIFNVTDNNQKWSVTPAPV